VTLRSRHAAVKLFKVKSGEFIGPFVGTVDEAQALTYIEKGVVLEY
jgi:hypothetical protein